MSDKEAILKAIEYTDKVINDNLNKGKYANWVTNDALITQRAWLLQKLIAVDKGGA